MESAQKAKKEKMEQVAKRKFFYVQSFESYGGVSGFFDYGPHMCALQNNFLSEWRKHFILEESMLEVDTAIITPFEVLKSSGHVEKFTDLMCSDSVTGDIYRADHLVRDWLEKEAGTRDEIERIKMMNHASVIDSYSKEELQELIKKYGIKSENQNELTPVVHFNLMFSTIVGPGGKMQSFLRPETAQGQFLNFKRLLETNGDKMPFASAMVGKAFRNEISPRTGLFRVREFLMAEIEHYVHPLEKDHPKFGNYSSQVVPLLFKPKEQKEDVQSLQVLTIGEAVKKSVVNNETLGYFIARVYLFLTKIGIPQDQVRFRQHLPTEMAHYATDCWDAEINTPFGWIECVGIADRACYDLTVHSDRTNERFIARRTLPEPVKETKLVPIINKKEIGARFRSESQSIIRKVESLSQDQIKTLLNNNKIKVSHGTEQVEFVVEETTVTKHVEEYVPNVIEPSFGIGRILYALLWHAFSVREEDEQRTTFQFTPIMAPIKCMLLPLQEHTGFTQIITSLRSQIISLGISCNVDESKASIGRRYSRADEIGIPFCVTIDFESLEDNKATIRERDSTHQIRLSISEIPAILSNLALCKIQFSSITSS
ncbi:glycyl-tRNA synthetase [Nematocida sp. AWRm80]|nr:glycyl-tRNA synthetase [Nematocida sp. AWRm80]